MSGARLSTGTVDLKVENADSVSGYTALNLSGMEPGDSSAAVLTVTNSGTAPVSYYVEATTTGIASQLSAKVTTATSVTGSAPSATCGGTALAGSGIFDAGMVSSSAALSLPGGTSQKLCIEAKLPNNGVAQGGSGTVGLTFRAITGSSTSPGWADSVPLSGPAVGAATAFYLGSNTNAQGVLLMRQAGPTSTFAPAGLLVKSSGAQAGRSQMWVYPVGSTPLTLAGTSSLRIWSAPASGSKTASGSLQMTLYDCDSTGTSCNPLITPAPVSATPWSSTGTYVSRVLPIITTANSYTWQADRGIGILVSNTGANDLLLAVDTTSYRSALLIQ